jgi:biopolymer transport protein ExbB
MSIESLFIKGGVVVWILAGYSIVGLAIVLERYLHFWRMGRTPADLPERIQQALHGDLNSESFKADKGPESAVVAGMLESLKGGVEQPSQAGMRVRADELKRMQTGLPTLGILGNTAPLLGLLGTIIGMIKAFMVIEAAGGKVDAAALAGGIWEAMITTGVGLSVAIPVLILLHFLEGLVERRVHAMDSCISLVSEHFSRYKNGKNGKNGSATSSAPVHRWEDLTDAV